MLDLGFIGQASGRKLDEVRSQRSELCRSLKVAIVSCMRSNPSLLTSLVIQEAGGLDASLFADHRHFGLPRQRIVEKAQEDGSRSSVLFEMILRQF
jgi:hypothetical protein